MTRKLRNVLLSVIIAVCLLPAGCALLAGAAVIYGGVKAVESAEKTHREQTIRNARRIVETDSTPPMNWPEK